MSQIAHTLVINSHSSAIFRFTNKEIYHGGYCSFIYAYDPIPTDENYHGVGGAINGHVNDIFNSSFYANTADYSGPDFAAWYSGKLVNVTMSSGIDCPNGSNLTIVNSIIHQMGGNCDVTFMNSLYGEVNVTSITDGGGNLPGVDPLFIDQEGGCDRPIAG